MLLTFLGTLALAQTSGDVHEHGKAVLSLTSDGTSLIAEFTTDQHTLYGLDEKGGDHEAAVNVRVTAAGALFELETSAACTQLESSIAEAAEGGLMGDHDDHDDDDRHHDDDHHHEHDHGDHHEGHHDHDDHSEHVDMTVRIAFSCDTAPKIGSVVVNAFDTIPSLEDVDVVVLTNDQQAEASATRQRQKVRLP